MKKELKEKNVEKVKKEKIENSNNKVIISAVVTFVICAVLFGIFYEFYLKNLVIETTRIEKDVTVTDKGIADAVEKIYDSVVVVETYNNGVIHSTGTGFVFKKENGKGYILTNYHVIDGGAEVKVIFTNEESVVTEVVGGDQRADTAVLSVPEDKVISVSNLGNSEDLRIGDTTFAVGAPIDSTTYSWTVTRGILSGKNRIIELPINDREKIIMELLQTDTAINSGNSGGPLCNSNGEVIGVTNSKLDSSQIEGIAFAIPIETALEYANKFINGEEVKRPYIGISIYDSNSFLGMNEGVIIDEVLEDSPAEKAGLKKGDKILKVNDKEVKDTSYFLYELYKYEVGEEVTITIERDKKEKDIKVVLGTQSENV